MDYESESKSKSESKEEMKDSIYRYIGDIALFPHQIESVKNMINKENFSVVCSQDVTIKYSIGVLADIPGYGKSYSVVKLCMLDDNKDWPEGSLHCNSYITMETPFFQTEKNFYFTRIKTTLILASSSIVHQWKEYFSYSNLKCCLIINEHDIKNEENKDPKNFDVVIISAPRYNEYIERVNRYKYAWRRFVFDEAQSTYVSSMIPIVSKFTWLVTATPNQLIGMKANRSHMFRDVFNYYNCTRILNLITVKNDDEFVKSSFKMPETIFKIHKCVNLEVLNVIRSHINNSTYEMIQAGNIAGAIESLGGSNSTSCDLITIVTNKKKKALEIAESKIVIHRDDKKKVEEWTSKRDLIIREIKEIEDRFKDMLKSDCPICFSTLEKPVMMPCCQYILCGKCILDWVKKKKTCCMCRQEVKLDSITYITDDENERAILRNRSEQKEEKEEKKAEVLLSKPDTVIKIIKDGMRRDSSKRFIIFSNYDQTYNIIKKVCKENEIQIKEVKGRSVTRNATLRNFKDGAFSVIFLNGSYNGAGINLECTSDIILYHDVPDDTKKQLIGRGNRIGRKGNLTIHLLE